MSESKRVSWVIDEEMNLIHADDDRHTIICNFSATLKNPEVMADARKIIAASDMAEALQIILANVPMQTAYQALIHAALKKAGVEL